MRFVIKEKLKEDVIQLNLRQSLTDGSGVVLEDDKGAYLVAFNPLNGNVEVYRKEIERLGLKLDIVK